MYLHPAQPVSDIPGNSSGQAESTVITPVAITGGVNEIQTATCAAVSGAAQGDYFTFANAAGEIFAVWLDIDANGTAPTGAAYVASDYQIEVDVVTGDLDTDVATKVRTAVIADADFIASGITMTRSSAILTLTQPYPGNVTAPGKHNTGDTGDGSFVVDTDTAGASPSINSKYFLFSSATVNYYGWFNVNGFGSDPSVASKTGAAIAINGDESVVGIGTAAAAVITALAGITCYADGDGKIIITGDTEANIPNAGAGNSGYTVDIKQQGYTERFAPGFAAGSISNSPSVISAAT